MNTTCPSCGCDETELSDEHDALLCCECGEVVHELTAEEQYDLDFENDEPNDAILAQQELEDFEGHEFYNDGECYDFEGCCDE